MSKNSTTLIVGHAIADLDAGADAGAGADGTTPGVHGRDGWNLCIGHVSWTSTRRDFHEATELALAFLHQYPY